MPSIILRLSWGGPLTPAPGHIVFPSGHAEDIEQGLVRGAARPQVPLALADLIGLDTTKAVAESLYEELKEPPFALPPLLARKTEPGWIGPRAITDVGS